MVPASLSCPDGVGDLSAPGSFFDAVDPPAVTIGTVSVLVSALGCTAVKGQRGTVSSLLTHS
jgi:hypothetical protein